ncbi:hypothetical protein ACVWZA_002825 [Sphingomonas sp. UYAg733]
MGIDPTRGIAKTTQLRDCRWMMSMIHIVAGSDQRLTAQAPLRGPSAANGIPRAIFPLGQIADSE